MLLSWNRKKNCKWASEFTFKTGGGEKRISSSTETFISCAVTVVYSCIRLSNFVPRVHVVRYVCNLFCFNYYSEHYFIVSKIVIFYNTS